MRVLNLTRQVSLVENGSAARSLLARARGLLGHAPLVAGEGLLIAPCQSIHSFFMAFPFDAAFLDGAGCVLHLIQSMPPGRVSPHLFRARAVLELPAGILALTGTQVGDILVVQE